MLRVLSMNCTGQFDLFVLHEGVGPWLPIMQVDDGRNFGRRICELELF
jgi:hypothetical protein